MRCAVWAEAAKWLGKFEKAVLTTLDSDGYPVSVRVDSRAYDAATGELRATLPGALHVVEGPANLLCHYHDEKLWKLNAITIKGRVENRDGSWVFATTSFNAPSKLAMLSFIKGVRSAGKKYLDRRDLDRPEVDWAAVKEIQRRAKR
jgi:hypothetical protein